MDNSYLSLLKKSWKFAREKRKYFILTYVLFVISNICASLSPLILGRLINRIQAKNDEVIKNIWLYVLVVLGLFLFQYLFHGPGRIVERRLAFYIGKNFLQDLYIKLMRLPVEWHKESHSGSTIDRLNKSTHALRDFYQNGFSYIKTFTQFLIALLAIIYFSPFFGIISILVLLIGLKLIVIFDKYILTYLKRVNEAEHVVSSSLSDNLSNILTLISLRLETQSTTDLLRKVDNGYSPFIKNVLISEWKWFSVGLFINMIYCSLILAYCYNNFKVGQTFYIGGLVTLIGFINQLTNSYFNFANQYNTIIQYDINLKSSDGIVHAYENINYKKSESSIPKNWYVINIRGLGFNYKPNVRDLGNTDLTHSHIKPFHSLFDINLLFKRGKHIALIGPSGSGKTSLMSVLKGLYLPSQSTELFVDGEDGYDWECLSNSVTLFPQQPELFENTIRYNLTLGLSYSEEEINNACEIVMFSDVIRVLPNGIDTSIFEDGVNLSGGQKQRLALARGILASKDSSVLLLDEPTSNIDQETEHKIYCRLFSAFRDKVIMASVHRLHLLDMFDYVYEIDNGKIVSRVSKN